MRWFMLGLVLMIVLWLVGCVEHAKDTPSLKVSREMIAEHPEEVNAMIRDAGITNVRIQNQTEFEESQKRLLPVLKEIRERLVLREQMLVGNQMG